MRDSVASTGVLNRWTGVAPVLCLDEHPSSSQELVGTAMILENPNKPPFLALPRPVSENGPPRLLRRAGFPTDSETI